MLPGELDKDVLRVFTALFEKSSQPQNYLYQLRSSTGPRETSACWPAWATRSSATRRARSIRSCKNMSGVLGEVRDEATADSIVERIAEMRSGQKTEIDRRAWTCWKCSSSRGGRIAKPARAACRGRWRPAAGQPTQWSAGEPRLMADLLASLGHIPQQLADEQVRKLESLHREAAARHGRPPAHRSRLGPCVLGLRPIRPGDRPVDRSLDEHQGGLRRRACPTRPTTPSSRSSATGKPHAPRPGRTDPARGNSSTRPTSSRNLWLTQRLYQLYENAIANDGEVSLGMARTLPRRRGKLAGRIGRRDQNHRYYLVNRLCRSIARRTASSTPRRGRFAPFRLRRLPDVVERQTNNYTRW